MVATFAGAPRAFAGELVQERFLQTPEGPQGFLVHQAVNANGELEIQVEHEELRALIPGETRAVVLYGRDLDGDGRIDAWFYPGKHGIIHSVDTQAEVEAQAPASAGAPSPDSISDEAWKDASRIILQQNQYKNRWFVGLLANAIFSRVTITQAMGDSFQAELTQEEIDLNDLGIRVARLQREDPTNYHELLQYELLLSDAWGDLAQQISTDGIRDRFLYAAGDILLYASGAAMAKGFGVALKWGFPKLMASAGGVWAAAAYDSFRSGISDIAARASDAVSERASRMGLDSDALDQLRNALRWPAFESAEQAVREFLTERIPATIRGLNARGRVALLLARSADLIKAVGHGAYRQWKYLVATQTLQLGTEIYNRRDALFSPNPIVFAKRVFTNKGLLQDMVFMSLDTTLQTGVSAADKNVKRRMVVCGILSLIDSNAANLIISKDPDAGRNALDTAWEISIGNVETQIDVTALQKFEMMAEHQDNPKLALIGYAIALTDDTIGSYAYEKVTHRYETDKKKGKPMFSWIPIFAPK